MPIKKLIPCCGCGDMLGDGVLPITRKGKTSHVCKICRIAYEAAPRAVGRLFDRIEVLTKQEKCHD